MQEFHCVAGLYTIPAPSNKPDLPDGRKFYVIDNQIKEYITDNLCCYEYTASFSSIWIKKYDIFQMRPFLFFINLYSCMH